MDNESILAELLDLAEAQGIEIRKVRIDSEAGSLCCLRGKWVLFIDDLAPAIEQLDVVASALAGIIDIQQIYLKPQIREIIEKSRLD